MFVDERKLYEKVAEKQMTVRELVEKAGVTYQTIASIKRGWRSTTRTVGKLAAALGCKPADILKEEVE